MDSGDNQEVTPLPEFDEAKFKPPQWATTLDSLWANNGESSSAGESDNARGTERSEESDGESVYEDALSSFDPEELMFSMFTTIELKELLSRAINHKNLGNTHYTSKPPQYNKAIECYKLALDHLPAFPKVDDDKDDKNGEELQSKENDNEGLTSKRKDKGKPPRPPISSGIQELTEEEAEAINEVEEEEKNKTPEQKEREEVKQEIEDATKACYGNLAACYISLKDDDKAIAACNDALKIDPHYTKALHRRASVNERRGNHAALTSALADYELLRTLLPPSSPLIPSINRSLSTLPPRIKVEEKKQYDEMMGKLKELGNSLLGNFGLSTDNFKFEQQPGGGYTMNFSQ
ncbi:uncharacterized protein L203_104481 [Cryptococcus depauperatus CBS 7841]|uniref:Tetratricopeptide repeat protein 1 n=1 Tax=Cryptococcus depauperatus CBS 7841 TaxID=1295531 RepID=A0AAJ8JVR3_9TREE